MFVQITIMEKYNSQYLKNMYRLTIIVSNFIILIKDKSFKNIFIINTNHIDTH